MIYRQDGQLSIWIIILNWNNVEDTLVCLESLSHVDPDMINVQTLVVDNGSRESPQYVIEQHYPQIKIICLERNFGFAGGCNVGIRAAIDGGGDYILLLNNDTTVHPDFLHPLIDHFRTNPTTGIIAPLICYSDEPNKVWFAGGEISLAFGQFRHKYRDRNKDTVPALPIVSEYVTGCCMMISASTVRTIGMLDERFFAYYEDVDLCIRAQKQGFDVFCVPQSMIWHQVSASTRTRQTDGGLAKGRMSPLKHYLVARNRIALVRKHANTIGFVVFLLIGNTIISIYYLGGLIARRRWKRILWFCRGVLHGLQQRLDNPSNGEPHSLLVNSGQE